MNVYTHARLYDLAGAVEGLPQLLPAGPETEDSALAATGTDGNTGHGRSGAPRPRLDQNAEIGCEPLRAIESRAGSDTPEWACPNSFPVREIENDCDSVRADEASYPARIRTWTKGTKIPCATVTLPGIHCGLSPHFTVNPILTSILL